MEQSVLPCMGQGDFPKHRELEPQPLQIWTRGIVSSLYVTHALQVVMGREGDRETDWKGQEN